MSKVLKGRITVANATTCQIKVNDSPANIIPNVIIPYEMQGNIHVGDYVAFVLFNDLSGLVLNLMSGSGSASGISVQTDLESDDPATLPGGTLPGVTGVLPPRHGGTGTTTGMGAAIDFDSIDISGVLPVDHGGTGTTVAMSAQVDLEKLTAGTLPGDIGVKGILGIANGGTGNSAGYIRTGQKSGTTPGTGSTANGAENEVTGNYADANGYGLKAIRDYQHVFGKFNVSDDLNKYVEIVGNGTADNARSWARILEWDGTERLRGNLWVGDDINANGNIGCLEDLVADGDVYSYGMDVNLTPFRKDLTINSPVSDSTHTGYSYKQAFTWNGVTADHFGDVALKSGTYTGDMAMLTAANSVTLFFSANPSGIVVTVVVFESKLVT